MRRGEGGDGAWALLTTRIADVAPHRLKQPMKPPRGVNRTVLIVHGYPILGFCGVETQTPPINEGCDMELIQLRPTQANTYPETGLP
jgi:hypothetical protein